MSGFEALGGTAGGVGLFLLGMWLMTDGLKLAAGRALERILTGSTKTRLRGLATGITVTALVQSSSAVTVASIGFVNAGLLSLGGALWVLFGANVGTTITGWLVALVGLQFKIETLALPLIGIGMLLRLGDEVGRRGALGTALAGFGVLFLGIDLLRSSFSGIAAGFTLPHWDGFAGVGAMVLIGILMTVLMQASAAALVIAFSAAQSGFITLEAAAAVVIGANVGTTVTAVLAALGATPNAKRAALAHVLFNVLTGIVALLLLPWLLALLEMLRGLFGLAAAPAAQLALFHTVFNVLGVLLVWPLADMLVVFLEGRFRSAEEDEARPRYLDKNVLAVATLAFDALDRELRHLGGITSRIVRAALVGETNLAGHERSAASLSHAIALFIAELSRTRIPAESARRLPSLLRIARYYEMAAELAAEATAAAGEAPQLPAAQNIAAFRATGERVIAAADPTAGAGTPATLEADLGAFEAAYQRLKAELIELGARGVLEVTAMDARLRAASALRRAVEQVTKAARLLAHLADHQDATGA
ncbi:Na/Pi cotransporter family protein [Sulfuricystis multivorans]|uniref:Na/Pi cotransporter family protein n=1 Tax=Sulfuricystis multivorans TaxID=2211108 RepID=UPI000F825353|nr:Na/Pi symporter [Sulfuricystis multivorans]